MASRRLAAISLPTLASCSSHMSSVPSRETLAAAAGWTLAHAHARTGDRFEIAGYLGETDAFDKAIAKFARAYADQNDADYARFMAALQAGELAQ